jgi:hypothetical protein
MCKSLLSTQKSLPTTKQNKLPRQQQLRYDQQQSIQWLGIVRNAML